MSKHARIGAVALCAWLSLHGSKVMAECTKLSLLKDSGVTNGPLYLQWPCSASIPVGCVNCPGSNWVAVVESAKNSWASQNSSYSFTSSVNVTWIVTDDWPANLQDDNVSGAAMQYDQDENGYIKSSLIWINNWNYGFSIEPNPEPGYYDFESVMIHEIGHVLGLDDADCYSVMSDLNVGETQRYPLDLDDEAIDLLYCCDQGRVLADGQLAQVVSTCGDGNPAAESSGLKLESGNVSWTVWDERGTREYLIEGLHTLDGPAVILARENSGVGAHSLQLPDHDFSYLRLVEIERGGRRSPLGVISAHPGAALYPVDTPASRDEQPSTVARPLPTGLPSGERIVIYTHESLLTAVMPLVDYWEGLGYQVGLNWFPHHFSDEFDLASGIAYAAGDGIKYFHIVGGWSDYFAAPDLWDSAPYWRAKRDNYLLSGRLRSAPDEGASIPPTIRPDADLGPLNTARTRPYIFSDQGYADVDVDGTPDVVVTRWPVTTAAQVTTLISKVTGYGNALAAGTRRPDRTTFFVGDIVSPNADPAETVELASLIADKLLDTAPAHSTTTFLESDHLTNQVNDTAAHLNSWNPDLLVMLSTYSTCEQPGSFFPKDGSPAWSMGLLNSGTQAALVASGSCNAAEYTTPCGTFAQPVCNDFLFTPNKGALAWLGPTTGSWQLANYAVERFLVEEMFQNPYRPMAESWLVAMQRAYDAFGTSSDYALTLDSYVFLGDPVSPFARLPETDVDGYVNDKQHMMPTYIAVGCPQGDKDDLIVEVRLDAADVISAIPQDALTLAPPSGASSIYFPQQASIPADSAAALMPPGEGFSNGYCRTTFTVPAFGGCEERSALVSLYGLPLVNVTTKVRSPDLNASGRVDVVDFSTFASGFPVNPAVNDCRDFNNDNKVDLGDFAIFGPHNNHHDPAHFALAGKIESSNAGVVLRFTDEYPTATTHRLLVDVDVDNFTDVTTSLFALVAGDARLTFVDWMPSQNSLGTVIFAPVAVEGDEQLYFGTLTDEEFAGSSSVLGRLVFDVTGTDPLVIDESDFVMVAGDVLLESGGEAVTAARMAGVLNRTLDPAVARIYYDRLEQNFPNPLNPTTTLAFSIKDAGNVSLTIYDVAGRRVRELVNERRERGAYKIVWDGQNDAGQIVASGVYFYKMTAGSFTDTKKMTILK